MCVEFCFAIKRWFAISHCAFEFPVNVSIGMGLLVRPNIVTVSKPPATDFTRVWLFQCLQQQIEILYKFEFELIEKEINGLFLITCVLRWRVRFFVSTNTIGQCGHCFVFIFRWYFMWVLSEMLRRNCFPHILHW